MKKLGKILYTFLKVTVVSFLILLLSLFFVCTIIGGRATSIANTFKKYEEEVVEASKELLEEKDFLKEGDYLLYLSEGEVKVDTLDLFDEPVKAKGLGTKYSELFRKKWLRKKDKILVNTFISDEDSKCYRCVVYKKDFFFGKYTAWTYYGDPDAFPYCPDLAAYRLPPFGEDNKKQMTKNLYFAYAHY